MSPHLASIICSIGILGLFVLDRDRQVRTSKALWIPVVWLSICSSRMVSQWLTATGLTSPTQTLDTAAAYLDGSPLDRFLLTGLTFLAVIVLVGRRQKVGAVLRANAPILLFLLYCGVSTLWSDYPGVSFKRWIKALADLAMVLIVLTERDRYVAAKRLLARVGFCLIPPALRSRIRVAHGANYQGHGGPSPYWVADRSRHSGGHGVAAHVDCQHNDRPVLLPDRYCFNYCYQPDHAPKKVMAGALSGVGVCEYVLPGLVFRCRLGPRGVAGKGFDTYRPD